MFRSVRRAAAASTLLAVSLLAAGCDDQRGAVLAPSSGILDDESVFGTALIFTTTFTMLNELATEVLDAYEAGTPLPFTVDGCSGGIAVVNDNDDADPTTFELTFALFTTGCGTELPLTVSTDTNAGGAMIMTILETSPGLAYTLELPYDFPNNLPIGITVQLPAEIGFDLALSTPGSLISYVLDRDRGAAEALLEMRGTFRWEDRPAFLNLVQELVLSYPVDWVVEPPGEPDPVIERYPIGAYQVGAWSQGASGFPVNVGFEGDGFVFYTVDNLTCNGNLLINEIICSEI